MSLLELFNAGICAGLFEGVVPPGYDLVQDMVFHAEHIPLPHVQLREVPSAILPRADRFNKLVPHLVSDGLELQDVPNVDLARDSHTMSRSGCKQRDPRRGLLRHWLRLSRGLGTVKEGWKEGCGGAAGFCTGL